jgi:signal transduction histidine kinase
MGQNPARKTNSDGDSVDQPSVLIISDEAAFSRAVTNRWRAESDVPAFTLLGSDPHWGIDGGTFDLAIVGGVSPAALSAILRVLSASGKPVLVVVEDGAMSAVSKEELPRSTVLHRTEGWKDALVLVGVEILTRVEAIRRMKSAEAARTSLEREATLGRYMLDTRHTLNNALTAILGNSELLLLEPGDLPPNMVSQLGTIRTMALRIHESLQRFSSLEKEMMFAERQTVKDAQLRRAVAACD